MNPVDLNNSFYSKGIARMLIGHISHLAGNKCCPDEYCCYTCFLIKTFHDVGTLEYMITLVDSAYYDWLPWWDLKTGHVDITWLEKQWKCPDDQPALAEAS